MAKKGTTKTKRDSQGQVFLAHSSKNRKQAAAVYRYLEDRGIRTWYGPPRITAGNWLDAIGLALRTSNAFVLLLSPDATRSRWVKRELEYALTHPQYDRRIVIAELARADLEDLTWALAGQHIIRLHPTLEKRLPLLLRALKRLNAWCLAQTSQAKRGSLSPSAGLHSPLRHPPATRGILTN